MSSSFKRRGKKAAVVAPAPSVGASSSHPQPQPIRIAPSPTPSPSILPGTRPWTSGLVLTSTGLRECDGLLFSSSGDGGGQPLQTSTIVEEDRLSDDLARAVGRCWCAEGVAQGQLVLLGSFVPSVDDLLERLDGAGEGGDGGMSHSEGCSPEELDEFVRSLPRNLHLDKAREKAKKQSSESTAAVNVGAKREAISAIIEEEEEEDDDADDGGNAPSRSKDEGLVNAWQYRKSIQDARRGLAGGARSSGAPGGGDGVYCHSYDLSRRMWDQFSAEESEGAEVDDSPLVSRTKVVDCSAPFSTASTEGTLKCQQRGMRLFRCLWKHLQSAIADHPPKVVRLFLPRLPVGPGAVALPLLVAKIRRDNLPVVLLATIRPWRWLSSSSSRHDNNKLDMLATLRNTADVACAVDALASLRAPPPPEFSLLQGILTVRKCAPFATSNYTDAVAGKRPSAERFGIKRDGRKLTVQLLHLPPEEYSKGGSSTSGVRSGGGNVVGAGAERKPGTGGGGRATAGGCSSLGGGASLDF